MYRFTVAGYEDVVIGNINYVFNSTYILQFTGKYIEERQDMKRTLYIRFSDNPNYNVRTCQIEFTCGRLKLTTPRLTTNAIPFKFDNKTGKGIAQSIVPYLEGYDENMMTIGHDYEETDAVLELWGYDTYEYEINGNINRKDWYLLHISIKDPSLYMWDDNRFFADGYYGHVNEKSLEQYGSAYYNQRTKQDSHYYTWQPSNIIFYKWGIKQVEVDMSQYYKVGTSPAYNGESQAAPITLSEAVEDCTSKIVSSSDANLENQYRTIATQVVPYDYKYCIRHKANASLTGTTIKSNKCVVTSNYTTNVICKGDSGVVSSFPVQLYVIVPWRIAPGSATVQLETNAQLYNSSSQCFETPVSSIGPSYFPSLKLIFQGTSTILYGGHNGTTDIGNNHKVITKVEGDYPKNVDEVTARWYYYNPEQVSITLVGNNSSYITHDSWNHRFGFYMKITPTFLNAVIETFDFTADNNWHTVVKVTCDSEDLVKKITVTAKHPNTASGTLYETKTTKQNGKGVLTISTLYPWREELEVKLTIPDTYRFSRDNYNTEHICKFRGNTLGTRAVAIYACMNSEADRIIEFVKRNMNIATQNNTEGNANGWSRSKYPYVERVSPGGNLLTFDDLWMDTTLCSASIHTNSGTATFLILFESTTGSVKIFTDPNEKNNFTYTKKEGSDKSLAKYLPGRRYSSSVVSYIIITVTIKNNNTGKVLILHSGVDSLFDAHSLWLHAYQ